MNRMSVLVALGLGVTIVGCAGGPDGAAPATSGPTSASTTSAPPIPAPLVGTWESTGSTGPRTLVDGAVVTLDIRPRADQFGLRAGCNTHHGPLEVTGDRLRTGRLGSTRMACEQRLMDQEQWVLALFASGVTWRLLDATTLEVANAGQKIRLARTGN